MWMLSQGTCLYSTLAVHKRAYSRLNPLLALYRSVKKPEERLNKVDLAAIRKSYDDADWNAVNWFPGCKPLAERFTKDNHNTAALLLEVLLTGQHSRPAEMKINLAQPCDEKLRPSLLARLQ